MMPMPVLLILFAALAVFGLLATLLLTRRLRRLTALLQRQQTVAGREESGAAANTFAPLLHQADLANRLQQGRPRREMPERYRFIRSLAERGVPAAEIAGILGLAPGEVDQLVTLARVARRPAPMAAASPPKKRGRRIQAKDFPSAAEMVVYN